MSAIQPATALLPEFDGDASAFSFDVYVRAIAVAKRLQDEADRRHAECVGHVGARRRDDPVFREALRRRMFARRDARVAWRWVVSSGLRDWLPHGPGN